MAAPNKVGLTYFSHDVGMSEDPKVKLLSAKYGIEGVYTYIRILELAYSEKGYYYSVNEDSLLLLSKDTSIDIDYLEEMIIFMVEKYLFDKDLYSKYKILTSKRIQKNFLQGCIRRKQVELNPNYLLINPGDERGVNHLKIILNDGVNVGINGVNVNINSEKDNINNLKVEANNINVGINNLESDIEGINDNINYINKIKENKIKEKERKEKKSKKIFEPFFTSQNQNDDLKLQDEKIEIIKSIIDKWNVFAVKHNLRTVKSLIGNGIKNILTRLDENEFDIDKILELSEQSEFLLTHGEKGKPITESFFTLQWIISDKRDESGMLNYEKILEGNYKNSNNNNQNKTYGTNRSRKGQSDFIYTIPD